MDSKSITAAQRRVLDRINRGEVRTVFGSTGRDDRIIATAIDGTRTDVTRAARQLREGGLAGPSIGPTWDVVPCADAECDLAAAPGDIYCEGATIE
jgi:hypothetical protein